MNRAPRRRSAVMLRHAGGRLVVGGPRRTSSGVVRQRCWPSFPHAVAPCFSAFAVALLDSQLDVPDVLFREAGRLRHEGTVLLQDVVDERRELVPMARRQGLDLGVTVHLLPDPLPVRLREETLLDAVVRAGD